MIFILFPHIVLLLATAFLAATAHGLGVRGTNADISSTKGGILVKNGKQTSCELGVIDSTAAFVAAPCLDFSKGVVDSDTTYEVYLDAGINNKAAKYTVNSITVHPEYNATSLVNPVAILQFNKDSTETWSNPIAIDRNNGWGDIVLVRRELADLNTMKWSTPSTATNQYIIPKNENNYVTLYGLNIDSFLCSNATTYPTSAYLTSCAVPYGITEVYIDNKPYVAGIYAFTELAGPSFRCSLFESQKSYYTLLANYVAFADKILGRKIGYYPNNNSNVVPQTDPNFSMVIPPDSIKTSDYLMGDFYSAQTEALKNDIIPDTTSSTDQITSTMSNNMDSEASSIYDEVSSNNAAGASTDSSIEPSSETSSDTVSNESGIVDDNHDSSSKRNLIIGIVSAVLGGLLLTSIFLYFYKKWKRARRNIYRNYDVRSDMHSILILDSGSSHSPLSVQLPPTPVYKPRAKINTKFPPPPSPMSAAHTPSIHTGSSDSTVLRYYLNQPIAQNRTSPK